MRHLNARNLMLVSVHSHINIHTDHSQSDDRIWSERISQKMTVVFPAVPGTSVWRLILTCQKSPARSGQHPKPKQILRDMTKQDKLNYSEPCSELPQEIPECFVATHSTAQHIWHQIREDLRQRQVEQTEHAWAESVRWMEGTTKVLGRWGVWSVKFKSSGVFT